MAVAMPSSGLGRTANDWAYWSHPSKKGSKSKRGEGKKTNGRCEGWRTRTGLLAMFVSVSASLAAPRSLGQSGGC